MDSPSYIPQPNNNELPPNSTIVLTGSNAFEWLSGNIANVAELYQEVYQGPPFYEYRKNPQTGEIYSKDTFEALPTNEQDELVPVYRTEDMNQYFATMKQTCDATGATPRIVVTTDENGKPIGMAETYTVPSEGLPQLVVSQLKGAAYSSDFTRNDFYTIDRILKNTNRSTILLYFTEVLLHPKHQRQGKFDEMLTMLGTAIRNDNNVPTGLLLFTSSEGGKILTMITNGHFTPAQILYTTENANLVMLYTPHLRFIIELNRIIRMDRLRHVYATLNALRRKLFNN